jgi:hypothetical protein
VFLAGAMREGNAWPVAEYPDFVKPWGDNTSVLRVEAANGNGRSQQVTAWEALPMFNSAQITGLARTLYEAPAARRRRAIRDLASSVDPSVRRRFHELWVKLEVIAIAPREQERVVSSRTVVHAAAQ